MNKAIRYRIRTWQDNWGERKWHFIIAKYLRVTFKRSQRVGWRDMGFVKTAHEGKTFESRLEALAFAQELKAALKQSA